MATAADSNSDLSVNSVTPPRSSAYTRLSQSPYELHEAVFKGDVDRVRDLLEEATDVVHVTDCHGKSFYQVL